MTTEDKEQNLKELSYRQSGVDVEAGYALIDFSFTISELPLMFTNNDDRASLIPCLIET